MGGYFGVRKWKNGNPVEDTSKGSRQDHYPRQGHHIDHVDDRVPAGSVKPDVAPGAVTNSNNSRTEVVSCGQIVTIADIIVEDSAGGALFTHPAMMDVQIPDVSYTDSDGSSKSVLYGQPITCTPCSVSGLFDVDVYVDNVLAGSDTGLDSQVNNDIYIDWQ